MGNPLEEALVGMTWAERMAFAAAAKALGHTRDTLAADGDTVAMLRKISGAVGKVLGDEVADAVGEALYDAAHEHCDDETGCTGGGAPWYKPVAARMVDPYGPLAAIAVTQQITRDAAGGEQETLDNAAWFTALWQRCEHIAQLVARDGGSTDVVRQSLVDTAALVVEWLEDLAKPGRNMLMPAGTHPGPSVVWRTWSGAEYDTVMKISCSTIANGYVVDAAGNSIYEDHPAIAAEIRRRGRDVYRDHAYSAVPVFGCDHAPDIVLDRDALIRVHQYEELVFGGYVCVHCTPLHTGDPDLNVEWPCPKLREAGVTNEEAMELITARQARIAAAAAQAKEVAPS